MGGVHNAIVRLRVESGLATAYRHLMSSLADLVSKHASTLRRILGARDFEIIAEGQAGCRVVANDVTIRLTWDWRDKVIVSSIEPRDIPSHPLKIDADGLTDLWLKARGGDWPARKSGEMTASQLIEELARIEQVLTDSFSDPTSLRDGLLFMAGYTQGYTHYSSVPDEAPPPSFVERMMARFRLRAV